MFFTNSCLNQTFNSFLSRTAIYWSIWTNDAKINEKFALHSIDVKLGTKEDCRISQSLAVFHRDWLNKLFRPNF